MVIGRYGIPPLRCTKTSKRSGERCKRWSTPGSTCCPMHSGAAGQVVRAAQIRLTIAELSTLDARPIREILADAVRLGDVAMRDLESGMGM